MGKKAKVARRRKKRKLSKNIGILSVVVVIVVIITLSALYQSQPQPTPKEPADKYFEFSEAIAEAQPSDETNSSIFISQIWFDLTPVIGDATEVYIFPLQGLVDIDDAPQYPQIIQGETELVNVLYDTAVKSDRENVDFNVENVWLDTPEPELVTMELKEKSVSFTINVTSLAPIDPLYPECTQWEDVETGEQWHLWKWEDNGDVELSPGDQVKMTSGYPVKFEVICHEARGYVTIYVTEFYPPLFS
jgi:hypothetical protein